MNGRTRSLPLPLLSIPLLLMMIIASSSIISPVLSQAQEAQEIDIFRDNFESYDEGTFPSAGGWEIVWDDMGAEHQVISTSYSYSPTKSFQLWERYYWTAVVQRKFSTDAPVIGYELSILIEERGSEHGDHLAFFCREVAQWGAYYGTVLFDHSDGKIKAEDGRVLGTWSPKTWYKVKVILDRRTNKYSVWINGELKGKDILTSRSDTNKINAIALAAGWHEKKVYYDDVRVFVVSTFDVVVKAPDLTKIVSLSTERETYCMDEIVKILFTIKNAGNVRLHLRVVLEIKDPSDKTIYDSHQVGQDKEYWLDPGQQISGSFSWKIPRTAPPGVYKVLMSVRDWDDWNMIYDYRWGGKPGPEFKVYALRVRLDSITLNGQTLSTSNPELRIAPGSRITGTLTFTVENVQPGGWITPVIWVTSWERGTVADGRVRVVSNSISSTKQFTVKIDVTAPGEPGTYYIGFFAGWMYSPDEVASNDHPPKYGDGDDIWDMKQSDWESILRDGRAPEGAIYGWPGRAIRVVVEKPSPQPQATNTGSNGILKFMVINYSYMFPPYIKMLGIMIPPNIEVLNVTAKILWPETYHGYRFNFYKVIWFRCYRVLYLDIFPGGTSIWQVNITYRETDAEVIPVEYDEIADPVADKLLDNIHHEWKAYPVRHNLKVNVSANYKYIIITPEDWIDVVRPLVEWKTKKGIPTFAASLQWINDNYPGNNLAQKIKEFLSDAYFAWHSHYVLLLGSTDLIPTWYRDLGGILLPSDWYYVCLDGEFDYLPEMIIGRLPATSKEMAKNMISKIIEYESSVPSGDWVRKILIIGGFDNEESAVELSKRIPKGYIPLKLLHGYNLTTNNVISLINQGVAMVYVFSHGTTGGFEGLDLTSVDLLSNKPVFPFFVVFACSTAPYHHANEQYIALKLLSSPQGGAIGYIGAPYPIFVVKGACLEGPLSPPFEETCSRPGLAFFYDSLTSLRGANISTALVYLGDPEMSLWTAVPPKSILINVPTKVWIGENITVTVIDSDTNQPLQGVIVRIFANSSWTELITNQMGQVTLKAPPSPSIINLRIYALFRNKPTELNTTVYVELPTTTVTTTYTTTQTVVVPTTVTTTYITTTTIPTTYTTTIRVYETTTVVKHETVTTTSVVTMPVEKTATLTVTTTTTVYERVVDWSTAIPIAAVLLVVGIAIGYLMKRR